jgi:tetratricopeptide (TPR) repeat protein
MARALGLSTRKAPGHLAARKRERDSREIRMIYEWYSGSDRSEEIPRALADLDRQFDDLPIEERLKRLEALLKRERDPNWRGYLRFRIAIDLKAAGRAEEARAALSAAITEFDPLAGNIRDVMPQYTGAFHRMILDHLQLDSDAETVAEYGSILAANMSESLLDSFGVALSLGYLARALNRIGHEHQLPVLYRLALNCAIRAHHAEPDNPIFLETLLYCYFNVRDAGRCRLTYDIFKKVSPPEELEHRVDEFMQRRFHEIGGRWEEPS